MKNIRYNHPKILSGSLIILKDISKDRLTILIGKLSEKINDMREENLKRY